MPRTSIIATAAALAVTALAAVPTASSALADTPQPTCHRVNPYLACTHGFKLKTRSPERADTHSQFRIKKLVDATSPVFHPARRLQGH